MFPRSIRFLAACAVVSAFPPLSPAADRGTAVVDVNLVYPSPALIQNGGRVYDVTNPPNGVTPAAGDGTTDDTNAFITAYNYLEQQFATDPDQTGHSRSYIIYLPSHTYLVSSTIIYNNATAKGLNNIHFVGQSRAHTTIQLANNATGFQSASTPTPVLTYRHPADAFNNLAGTNLCENLTINTGSGNPGAVGLEFQGANTGRVSNVSIISGDGNGYCGVWLPLGSIQAYFKDITITGFNYGITAYDPNNTAVAAANAENDTAWEHVSINNPKLAGIYMAGGGLSMRDLDLNQSTLHVPAMLYTSVGACGVLVDSHLNGGSSSSAAVVMTSAQQDLFARNVTVTGYATAISNPNATNPNSTSVAAPFISEYTAHGVTTITNPADQRSFALPVVDAPIILPDSNMADWVNVSDPMFVPQGSPVAGTGAADDSAAIAAAFKYAGDNGKTTVYFPMLTYNNPHNAAFAIPASVTRVDGMYGQLAGGYLSVNASSNPLLVVGKGGASTTQILQPRNTVVELCNGNFVNKQSTTVTAFVESCTNLGAGTSFCTGGETLYVRCGNDEQGTSGNTDFLNNGGTLWMMGYKTENKPVPSIGTQAGGYTEVLGGYANAATAPTNGAYVFTNASSNMSVTAFTNSPTETFTNAISETQSGQSGSLTISQLPARGFYANKDASISLYIGGARPNSPGMFANNTPVGTASPNGSVSSYQPFGNAATNVYFVDGSGSDINGTADSFQFVNSSFTGNATILAKVDSVDNTSPYAKAGVMIRGSTDPGAPFVAMLVESTDGAIMEWRTASGGAVSVTTKTSLHPPCWVKLVQTGASGFAGYTSPDGVTWTVVNSTTVSLPSGQLGGLAMTSHNAGTVGRAILEGVTLTTSP